MKKFLVIAVILAIFLCGKIIYAQDDDDFLYMSDNDFPYLSDDDVSYLSDDDASYLYDDNVSCLYDDIVTYLSDDDIPYLSDEDIAAIEMTLPDDVPEFAQDSREAVIAEAKEDTEKNEISRLNTPLTIYHLLILDRTYCSLNSDLGDLNDTEVLYIYRHGANGYLIAIYTSGHEGPVFPQLPNRSRIIVNLTTIRKNTIKEYINSAAFRRFVTNRRILTQIQGVL